VNTPLVKALHASAVAVSISQVDDAEVEEMWSSVGTKPEPRWPWHAMDHGTGKVLAYEFGRRQDEVFLQFKALLDSFGIRRFFTDQWGAYARHLAPEIPVPGKRNTSKLSASI
jgi:insertion element IS1 protein InsB